LKNFTVWIVQPPGYPHARALVEHAHSITSALRKLGHAVHFEPGGSGDIRNSKAGHAGLGRLIVFGAHLVPDVPLPADAIVYNAEQARVVTTVPHYIATLKRQAVWDYSNHNVSSLRALGVERITRCRVGYVADAPMLPKLTEDVDVLFVGSVNDRRKSVIDKLSTMTLADGSPLIVKSLFGVYGAERDHWYARAKVVLNVHYYEPGIFEIFRCAHLFANSKCVVTEAGNLDVELEFLAARATAYVPYEQLAATCRSLVNGPESAERRRAIALAGHNAFVEIDQVEEVRGALEASS
jgi:hypothetical protein